MQGFVRLIAFIAEHGDTLVEITKWNEAEFVALMCGMLTAGAKRTTKMR